MVPYKTVCDKKRDSKGRKNVHVRAGAVIRVYGSTSLQSLVHGSPASHHPCAPFAQLRANVQVVSKGFPLQINRTQHQRATEKSFPRMKRDCDTVVVIYKQGAKVKKRLPGYDFDQNSVFLYTCSDAKLRNTVNKKPNRYSCKPWPKENKKSFSNTSKQFEP